MKRPFNFNLFRSISLLLKGLLNIYVFVSTHAASSVETLLYRLTSYTNKIQYNLQLRDTLKRRTALISGQISFPRRNSAQTLIEKFLISRQAISRNSNQRTLFFAQNGIFSLFYSPISGQRQKLTKKSVFQVSHFTNLSARNNDI